MFVHTSLLLPYDNVGKILTWYWFFMDNICIVITVFAMQCVDGCSVDTDRHTHTILVTLFSTILRAFPELAQQQTPLYCTRHTLQEKGVWSRDGILQLHASLSPSP